MGVHLSYNGFSARHGGRRSVERDIDGSPSVLESFKSDFGLGIDTLKSYDHAATDRWLGRVRDEDFHLASEDDDEDAGGYDEIDEELLAKFPPRVRFLVRAYQKGGGPRSVMAPGGRIRSKPRADKAEALPDDGRLRLRVADGPRKGWKTVEEADPVSLGAVLEGVDGHAPEDRSPWSFWAVEGTDVENGYDGDVFVGRTPILLVRRVYVSALGRVLGASVVRRVSLGLFPAGGSGSASGTYCVRPQFDANGLLASLDFGTESDLATWNGTSYAVGANVVSVPTSVCPNGSGSASSGGGESGGESAPSGEGGG